MAKGGSESTTGKPATPGSPTPAPAASGDPLEALFVGKTWVSPAGTAYTFEANGNGHTQADALKWHRIEDGIVEVELPGRPKASTRYFKFVSASEAYYNGDRNDITKPVHLK
jgi:hypothetical protein